MARTTKRRTEYELSVQDKATAALKRIDQRIGQLDKEIMGLGATSKRSTGTMIAGFKSFATVLGGISLAALGKDVIQTGAEFEKSMALIAGLSKEAAAEVPHLSQELRDLAVEGGANLNSLSAAAFDVISATGDVGGSMTAVKSAMDLAIAGGTDTATTMDALTSIMGNFSLTTGQAGAAAEALFRAQQGGKVTMEQLARSIGNVATSARAAGVSYEEMLGSLAAVTAGGLGGEKTQVGATSVARMFDAVAKAGEDVIATSREMAAEAGVVDFEFSKAQLASDGLAKFLEKMARVTKGDTQALEKLGIATEAAKGTQILLKDGAAATTELLADQRKEADELGGAVAIMQETTSQKMERLNALWKESKLIFFDEFSGPLKEGFEGLLEDTDSFREGVEALADSARFLGNVWQTVVGGIRTAIIASFLPLTEFVGGVAELGEKMGFLDRETANWMRAFRDGTRDAVSESFDDMIDDAKEAGAAFKDVFEDEAPRALRETGAAVQETEQNLEALVEAARRAGAEMLAALRAGAKAPPISEGFDDKLFKAREALRAASLRGSLAGKDELDQEKAALREAHRRRILEIQRDEKLTASERRLLRETFTHALNADIAALEAEQAQELATQRSQDATELEKEILRIRGDAMFELQQMGRDQTDQEITEINRRYDELRGRAEEFGRDTVAIEEARQAELQRAETEGAARRAEEAERLAEKAERDAAAARTKAHQDAVTDTDFGAGFQAELTKIQEEMTKTGALGADLANTLTDGLAGTGVDAMFALADGTENAGQRIEDALIDLGKEILATIVKFQLMRLVSGALGSAFGAPAPVGIPGGFAPLPPPTASVPLPSAAGPPVALGATSSGRNVIVNYSPSINAIDGVSAKRVLIEERETLSALIKRSITEEADFQNTIRNVR